MVSSLPWHTTASEYGVRATVEGDDVLALSDETHAPQLYRIVHDLVHEVLRRGSVRDVTLQTGGSNADGLALCFQGETLPGAEELNDVMQQLTYRARLIGARLETDREVDGELSVRVSL